MKKRITILGLLLSAAILAGCDGKPAAAPPLQEPEGVQPDKTAAYIGDIYDVTYFDFAVVPYVQELSFAMNGTVEKVHFYPGMEVAKGDVLVELDVSQTQAQARALEEELAHAEHMDAYADTVAQLDIELLQVELKELQENDASALEIQLKENEIAQKQAALRQTRKLRELETQAKRDALEKLNQTLAQDALYAPFSGRILYSDELTEGTQIKAYDPIVFLADNTKLQLSGEYIKPGLLKNADLVIAHIGDTRYEIAEKAMEEDNLNAAIASGKDAQTKFDFLAPETLEGKVEAGDYAAIFVYTDYIRDALLIPRGAVLTDAAGSYVYVDADGARVRREVKLGKVTDGLAQITEGLQEGEVVYVG
ncbi:MAG: biotin/lipoyl-binding protein [Oscillospiraceae bacterium]|nr:biotin/lipoyl-binding protein [Oscillospiraceae bacterium]